MATNDPIITVGPDGRPVYNPTQNDFDRLHREHNPPAPDQGAARVPIDPRPEK